MSKPKVYEYEGRTFEVEVYNDVCNEAPGLIAIYVNEVIRPKRKFFGRTRFFITTMLFSTNTPLLRQQ